MTTAYFAYGANMDPVHMAEQCPGAERLGRAILPDHRFAIAARGYGTVLPESGAFVFGVLWRLTPSDIAALDVFEGVPDGHYRQRTVSLRETPDGSSGAMIYVATDDRPGTAVPGYLERILEVAEGQDFPADYLASLRSARAV